MKKFFEIHKVRKNKVLLICFWNGDAMSSQILLPSHFGAKTDDELIDKIKNELTDLKINYEVYR